MKSTLDETSRDFNSKKNGFINRFSLTKSKKTDDALENPQLPGPSDEIKSESAETTEFLRLRKRDKIRLRIRFLREEAKRKRKARQERKRRHCGTSLTESELNSLSQDPPKDQEWHSEQIESQTDSETHVKANDQDSLQEPQEQQQLIDNSGVENTLEDDGNILVGYPPPRAVDPEYGNIKDRYLFGPGRSYKQNREIYWAGPPMPERIDIGKTAQDSSPFDKYFEDNIYDRKRVLLTLFKESMIRREIEEIRQRPKPPKEPTHWFMDWETSEWLDLQMFTSRLWVREAIKEASQIVEIEEPLVEKKSRFERFSERLSGLPERLRNRMKASIVSKVKEKARAKKASIKRHIHRQEEPAPQLPKRILRIEPSVPNEVFDNDIDTYTLASQESYDGVRDWAYDYNRPDDSHLEHWPKLLKNGIFKPVGILKEKSGNVRAITKAPDKATDNEDENSENGLKKQSIRFSEDEPIVVYFDKELAIPDDEDFKSDLQLVLVPRCPPPAFLPCYWEHDEPIEKKLKTIPRTRYNRIGPFSGKRAAYRGIEKLLYTTQPEAPKEPEAKESEKKDQENADDNVAGQCQKTLQNFATGALNYLGLGSKKEAGDHEKGKPEEAQSESQCEHQVNSQSEAQSDDQSQAQPAGSAQLETDKGDNANSFAPIANIRKFFGMAESSQASDEKASSTNEIKKDDHKESASADTEPKEKYAIAQPYDVNPINPPTKHYASVKEVRQMLEAEGKLKPKEEQPVLPEFTPKNIKPPPSGPPKNDPKKHYASVKEVRAKLEKDRIARERIAQGLEPYDDEPSEKENSQLNNPEQDTAEQKDQSVTGLWNGIQSLCMNWWSRNSTSFTKSPSKPENEVQEPQVHVEEPAELTNAPQEITDSKLATPESPDDESPESEQDKALTPDSDIDPPEPESDDKPNMVETKIEEPSDHESEKLDEKASPVCDTDHPVLDANNENASELDTIASEENPIDKPEDGTTTPNEPEDQTTVQDEPEYQAPKRDISKYRGQGVVEEFVRYNPEPRRKWKYDYWEIGSIDESICLQSISLEKSEAPDHWEIGSIENSISLDSLALYKEKLTGYWETVGNKSGNKILNEQHKDNQSTDSKEDDAEKESESQEPNDDIAEENSHGENLSENDSKESSNTDGSKPAQHKYTPLFEKLARLAEEAEPEPEPKKYDKTEHIRAWVSSLIHCDPNDVPELEPWEVEWQLDFERRQQRKKAQDRAKHEAYLEHERMLALKPKHSSRWQFRKEAPDQALEDYWGNVYPRWHLYDEKKKWRKLVVGKVPNCAKRVKFRVYDYSKYDPKLFDECVPIYLQGVWICR